MIVLPAGLIPKVIPTNWGKYLAFDAEVHKIPADDRAKVDLPI